MIGRTRAIVLPAALAVLMLGAPASGAPTRSKWPAWFPAQLRPMVQARPKPKTPHRAPAVRAVQVLPEVATRLPRPRPAEGGEPAKMPQEVTPEEATPETVTAQASAPATPAASAPAANAANGGAWSDPRGMVETTLALPAENPFPVDPIAAEGDGPKTIDREEFFPTTPTVAIAPIAPSATTADAVGPADAGEAIDQLARLPRPRPDAPPPKLAMLEVGPDGDNPLPAFQPTPAPPEESDAEADACLKRLTGLGVTFTSLPAIDPGGPCAVTRPLKVAAIGSGVAMASAATMNCHTAEALALWVRESVVQAAREALDAVPTKIAPGSTYACRPRNNQAGAKLSEHAHANAFDVMGFAFAGRPPVAIQAWEAGKPEGRFQDAIRSASCKYFTTVLGPGDAAHSNHLHLDLAERRGGYRLCSLGDDITAGRAEEKTKTE